MCKVQWPPLSERGHIHQTNCTKRSVWGLLNNQTLVYIIIDFFINFIRRRTEWLHKITRYLGHTSLFIFKLQMTRIFFFFFYLTCKFGQLVNIVRYAYYITNFLSEETKYQILAVAMALFFIPADISLKSYSTNTM
mgnify:CR=1 FL=1